MITSKSEKIVSDSTGCDLQLVKNTLKDFNGDIDGAIEYLIMLKQNQMGFVESGYKVQKIQNLNNIALLMIPQ